MNENLNRRAIELAEAERRLRSSKVRTPEWSYALRSAIQARTAYWDAKNELWDWELQQNIRPSLPAAPRHLVPESRSE